MSEPDLELYWIRHSESVSNTVPTISGRSNESALTPKGIEQSKRLGRFLDSQGIIPNVVYVSPAIRAIDTAKYCLDEMGLSIRPLIDDALQELDHGEWVGHTWQDIYTNPDTLTEIEKLGKDFKHGGAESINDASARGLGWIAETFNDYRPTSDSGPDRVFIFSHAILISSIASYILNLSYPETSRMRVPNSSVSLLVKRNNHWELQYIVREVIGPNGDSNSK